jgi:hypothetical protein
MGSQIAQTTFGEMNMIEEQVSTTTVKVGTRSYGFSNDPDTDMKADLDEEAEVWIATGEIISIVAEL